MSLAATVLNDFVLAYNRSNLDLNEQRLSNYGAYEMFRKDTPNLIPGYQELIAGKTSGRRPTKIPVLNKLTYTTGSARTCSAQTKASTSAFVTPSWTTITGGFDMIPAQYTDNYIGYLDDFSHKMRHLQRTFAEAMDTAGAAHLEANKAAVNNADGNPYTVAANAMVVPQADNELFFNELGPIMGQNDLLGPFNVVGSSRLEALVRQYSSQGTSNAENRAFQFGDYSFAYSNRVTVNAGDRDTIYAMPESSLAYMPWVDTDAKMGHESGDGKEWMVQNLPLLDHPVGVLYQSTCGDKSATLTGLDATLVESFLFSYDYVFLSAYNSSTGTLPGSIYSARFSKT